MSTKDVRNAIIATLAGINGPTGGYTYSLAASEQVKSGKYERPPAVAPFACVWTAQVEEEHGPTLGDREQQGTFMVRAWVSPANPKAPAARQDAAEDLLDDLRRALRANPRLDGGSGPTCIRHLVSLQPLEDGIIATTNGQSFGIVLAAITVTWKER